MWVSLGEDLAEEFGDNARFERWGVGSFTTTLSFHDPHEDADRWLTASPEARAAMAPVLDAKLGAFRRRAALSLVKAALRRGGFRTAKVQAARMREYRKQPAAKAKDNSRSAEWRKKNKEQAAEYLRQWRRKRTVCSK